MCFCAAVEVPKKSGVARLFKVFATAVLANFQDRLVMTTSISLRISTEIFYHIFPALSIANTVFLCLTDTKQRFLRNIERACRAKARHAVISLLIGYFFELRVELFE